MKAFLLVCFTLLTYNIACSQTADDVYWESGFGAPVLKNPDPAHLSTLGDDIYVVENCRLLKYNSKTNIWRTIGQVVSNNMKRIYGADGKLYVVGNFERMEGIQASRIAVWNDSGWTSLGDPLFGMVNDIKISESGKIYIAGNFYKQGASEAMAAATLTSGTWTQIGDKIEGDTKAIAVYGDKIYYGGSFSGIGEQNIQNIACWNETEQKWSSLDVGISGSVYSLATDDDGKLYAGGIFETAGRAAAKYIAVWQGTAWGAVGEGFSSQVYAIECYDGKIYAGGSFEKTGDGELVNYLAMFDGEKWQPLGDGVTGGDYPSVFDLHIDSRGRLLVGGTFNDAGGIKTNGYARWNGSAWEDIYGEERNGTSSLIHALLPVRDGRLYAGGAFITAGSIVSPGIAAFNGTNWAPINQGLQPRGILYNLVPFGNRLYFTGWFYSMEDTYLNNVAYFDMDNSTFNSIDSGIDASDYDMGPIAVDENYVYVSGVFTEVEGVASNKIIRWDGSQWKTMQGGISGAQQSINAMIHGPDGKLYVAGSFNKAGEKDVQNIAIWNAISERWEGINGGLNGSVYALAFSGTDLYIGGNFTIAGDKEARSIAVYNILVGRWKSLDSGVNGQVMCILPHGDDVFIGGRFTKAGDTAATCITKYNNTTGKFLPLGSGLSWGLRAGTCYAMAAYNRKLYVGGNFTGAGGKQSNNIACWNNLPVSVDDDKTVENAIWDIRVFPNPSAGKINLYVNLPKEDYLEITIINMLGFEVAKLTSGKYPAGENIIEWSCDLPSGGYIVKVAGGGYADYQRVLIVK